MKLEDGGVNSESETKMPQRARTIRNSSEMFSLSSAVLLICCLTKFFLDPCLSLGCVKFAFLLVTHTKRGEYRYIVM